MTRCFNCGEYAMYWGCNTTDVDCDADMVIAEGHCANCGAGLIKLFPGMPDDISDDDEYVYKDEYEYEEQHVETVFARLIDRIKRRLKNV